MDKTLAGAPGECLSAGWRDRRLKCLKINVTIPLLQLSPSAFFPQVQTSQLLQQSFGSVADLSLPAPLVCLGAAVQALAVGRASCLMSWMGLLVVLRTTALLQHWSNC